MRLRSPWVRVVPIAVAVAFLWSACGTEQGIEAEGEPVALSCASDRDEVVELLRSGLPTYDYEPASDLVALIETSDVVLAGTVGSVGRVVGEPDPDFGDNSWTVLSVQSPELLHAFDDVKPAMGEFSYMTSWSDGAGADPLAADISIEGLAFVAFLDFWEPAPGTYVADVQGLVVDCVDGTTPTPVIEPLPADAAGLSLTELARMVEVISGESVEALESGVDGPVLRHLAPEATDGEAAEIVNNEQNGIRRADEPDSNEARGDQPDGVTVERGRPLGELQTEPGPAEVKLWVSNQSFADDPIHVTVAIGDATLVDERFEVLGQHNSIAFDIKGLQPGVHTITAESNTGTNLTAEFTVLADEPRWLLLDYWYYPEDPEGRHFIFAEFDEPIGFD